MTCRTQASRGLAVVLLLWIVSAGTPAHAQIAGYRISFTPAVPTVHDAVTVALIWNGGCSAEGSIESARNGATITISHVFTQNPTFVGDSNCEEQSVIGPLPAGQYQVDWVS